MIRQANTEIATKAAALAVWMIETPMDGVIQWEAIKMRFNITKRDLLYSIVSKARRIAIRDGGAVFGTVHGIGIRRLPDAKIVGVADRALGGIRRTAKRARTAVACVNLDKLDRGEQANVLGKSAVLAMVESQTGQRAIGTHVQAQKKATEIGADFVKRIQG